MHRGIMHKGLVILASIMQEEMLVNWKWVALSLSHSLRGFSNCIKNIINAEMWAWKNDYN